MAQLVARLVRNEKVGGSNPPSSTAGQRTATALPGRSGRAVLRSRRGRSAPSAAGALRTAVAARSRAQVGRRYGFASGPVVGRGCSASCAFLSSASLSAGPSSSAAGVVPPSAADESSSGGCSAAGASSAAGGAASGAAPPRGAAAAASASTSSQRRPAPREPSSSGGTTGGPGG